MLERLRHDAADLIGEEIADVGRHSGRAVRALARTVSGRGVAVLAAEADEPTIEEELKELRPVLGASLVQLVAGRTGGGEAALRLRKAGR